MEGEAVSQAVRRAREEAIANAAAELFIERGIGTVKMTDIAQRCGIGVASLYRYYQTKTNVVVAAGTLLWHRYRDKFEQAESKAETGFDRMRELLMRSVDTYVEHPEFLSFLDDFDHAMLVEHVDRDLLRAYDCEVSSFYALYEQAFSDGIADGTIRSDVDFPMFYRAVSHALVGVGEKLIRGEILPSDDFSQGKDEMVCLVDMALGYLRKGL